MTNIYTHNKKCDKEPQFERKTNVSLLWYESIKYKKFTKKSLSDSNSQKKNNTFSK